MDCFVGAETGAFKSVNLRDSCFTNLLPVAELDKKQHEVTALTFAGESQTEVLIAQLNRQLRLFDCVTENVSNLFSVEGGEGRIRGVHVIPLERIVTTVESGAVRVWDKEGAEISACERGSGLLTSQTTMDGTKIAVAGKNFPLRLIDLQSQKDEWLSKNVAPNKFDLAVPVWDTQAKFMAGEQTLVTSTALHQLRVYDPRAQRRPVQSMEWGESPITALSLSPLKSHQVVVANTRGEMANFDLHKKKMLSVYRGSTGSIRCVQAHTTAPFVASAGIDRFVRVYNMETRKIISKVYCKTRLNALLLKNDLSLMKEEKEDEEDWSKMTVKGRQEQDAEDESSSAGENSDGEDVWEALEGGKKEKAAQVKSEEEENEAGEEPHVKRKRLEKAVEGEQPLNAEQEKRDSTGVRLVQNTNKAKKTGEKRKEEEDDEIQEILPLKKKRNMEMRKRPFPEKETHQLKRRKK